MSAYRVTMAAIKLFNFESTAVQRYANLRHYLERQGTSIEPNDVLIAAHALALECTLVTDNEEEFRRVPGLRVENWARLHQIEFISLGQNQTELGLNLSELGQTEQDQRQNVLVRHRNQNALDYSHSEAHSHCVRHHHRLRHHD
jgi:hypothetical protein